VATFTGCSIDRAGTYTLTATDSSLTPATSSSLTISVGSAELVAGVNELSVAVNVYVPARSIEQPVKVATPETAAFGLVVHDNVAPAGVVMLSVTALVSVVTTFPPASSTDTWGWVANGSPPVDELGWVVNCSCAALPTEIVSDALVAAVNDPSDAVSVYVPATSIAHPVKVATPDTAAFGFAPHDNVAPPGVVIANVTAVVSVVTTLPTASSTPTAGCVAKAVPPVELDGCVVNASFAAGPAEIVSELLTSAVSEPSVAVSVYVPATSIEQPENVATPATAAFGFAVHDNVAAPGVVIASVTELVSPVIRFPPASCTVTTGWVANGSPPSAPTGWVVNARRAAGPTVIITLVLTALVSDPSVAVSV